jgi:hypothetical protein
MPRRVVIGKACERCRKKRTKCNGKTPCYRCDEAGELCEYNFTPRESRDELRAQIKKLEKKVDDKDKLFRNLAPGQSLDARKSVRQVKGATGDADDVTDPSRYAISRQASHAQSPITTTEGPAGSPCFVQLLSWKLCCSRLTDHSLAETPEQSITLFLPTLPLDAYISQLQLDTWTRTGWTKAHIRHLFDALHLGFLVILHSSQRHLSTRLSQRIRSVLLISIGACGNRTSNSHR